MQSYKPTLLDQPDMKDTKTPRCQTLMRGRMLAQAILTNSRVRGPEPEWVIAWLLGSGTYLKR